MSDHTANSPNGRVRRFSRAEFAIYFALIFVIGLVFGTIGWVAELLLRLHMPARDPVRRAWADAQAITPQIFLA